MFEDKATGSWWRQQANGEAIVGPRKGKSLPEIPSRQATLAQWLALYKSLIMQPDPALESRYGKSFNFESGASRRKLTGTDTVSWHDKAWVVGITTRFSMRGDSLVAGAAAYALTGQGTSGALEPLYASQEFWHSWRTFQPGTLTY